MHHTEPIGVRRSQRHPPFRIEPGFIFFRRHGGSVPQRAELGKPLWGSKFSAFPRKASYLLGCHGVGSNRADLDSGFPSIKCGPVANAWEDTTLGISERKLLLEMPE